MLSKDNGRYVEESIRSVIAQTYQNWELIFMDDSSQDDTISQMMDLMTEAKVRQKDGSCVSRIHVSQNVESRGSASSMNSALRDARGKYIAFLNVGDLWKPTKLEKQIAFMEENGYAFTYTKYKYIDKNSKDRGDMMGGLEVVNHKDLIKCCWMGYMTVMYDMEKLLSPLPMFDKVKWRYEVFHTVEGLNPVVSVWLTIRNMIGGFVKKVKYVEKIK